MFTPYDYQRECGDATVSARRAGKRAALAVMASGLGKTVTAAFDALLWFEEHGWRGRLLYLCHQNDILAQARDTFRAVLGERLRYGFFTGQEKSAHRAHVVFASLQTMRRHAAFFRKDEFGYIVFDESHHTPAGTYLEVVRYFTPQFLLGLTATPDRRDGLNIRALYGEPVFNLPLDTALARNLVTPFDYRVLGEDISLAELGAKRLWSGQAELDTALFVPKRDEEIAATIGRHAAELPNPRTIVFASTILRSDQLVRSIAGSVTIHSRVSRKERVVRLELFRLGLIKTVVTVDCFNEGIDIPEANLIVFLRSTASPVIFFQQLGRGLRKAEGKEKVIVLDFVGNCDRITMLRDLSDAIERERSTRVRRTAPAVPARAATSEPPKEPPDEGAAAKEPSAVIHFDERVVEMLDIIKRVRRQCIADKPELMREYASRNLLTASHIAVNSRSPVWWVCAGCGYEYEMAPKQRNLGDWCPQCKERVTEHNNLAVTHPLIACEYDSANPLPVTAMKATGKELVWWRCAECGYRWRTRPKNRTEQRYNCPSCSALITYYKNNLGMKTPHLAEEYSYHNILAPSRVYWRSSKKAWWICSGCGEKWMAQVWARASGRGGCPVCTPKTATPTNNLVVAYPHLAEEYSSRNRRPVETVFAGTPGKFWWLCSECGRYFEATVRERIDGARCPFCVRTAPVSAAR